MERRSSAVLSHASLAGQTRRQPSFQHATSSARLQRQAAYSSGALVLLFQLGKRLSRPCPPRTLSINHFLLPRLHRPRDRSQLLRLAIAVEPNSLQPSPLPPQALQP